MDANEPPLLASDDVAAMLNVPVGTLRQWRSSGSGPPYFKVGRHVRYRKEDVTVWLRSLSQTG